MICLLLAAVLSLSYSEPKQVAPWLHEVVFSNYNDSVGQVVSAEAPACARGGCTSFREGAFLGRNMDWTLSQDDYFVIRTPANSASKRRATLGVACGASFITAKSRAYWDLLPHYTMDGINDCGVTCNVNMVPRDFGKTDGTASGKAKLDMLYATRYVLDYATNALHAVELLKNRSICDDILYENYEYHLMICDPNDTYIVETISNQLFYAKCGYGEQDIKPVMSNFFSLKSKLTGTAPDESPGAQGLERYRRALPYIGRIRTAEDMLACMRENWFSQSYTDANYRNWWSEWNGYKSGSHTFTHQDDASWDETRIRFIQSKQASYKKIRQDEAETGVRPKETKYYISSECAIYDITNRILYARMGERDVPFVFRLDEPAFTNLTSVFVNGDNVGAATMSREPGGEWTYDAETKTLTLLGTNSVTVSGLAGSGITLKVAQGGAISVPTEWIKRYFPNANLPANMVNKRSANGVNTYGESYLLGLDPTDANAALKADITVDAQGHVAVTFTPRAEDSKAAACGYEHRIKGKRNLTDEEWLTEDEQKSRGITPNFFRVFVEPR